jgi:hypothetical protein
MIGMSSGDDDTSSVTWFPREADLVTDVAKRSASSVGK